MNVPTHFELSCTDSLGHGRFHLGWQDDRARYHVWLREDGTPMTPWTSKPPVIYVNKLSTERTRDHKTSRRSLASHPKIEAWIKTLPRSLFHDAIIAADKREEERVAKAKAENIERLREEARMAGFMLVPIPKKHSSTCPCTECT